MRNPRNITQVYTHLVVLTFSTDLD